MCGSKRLDGAMRRRRHLRRGRRGAVAAQVAVCLVVLLGFTALTVDVGYLYNARAELQRTADAAALAAVQELGGGKSDVLAMQSARQTAANYAAANTVLGQALVLEESDVVFGRAYLGEAGAKYTFEPGGTPANAVRVRARRTADSPNGGVPLFFARILGISQSDVSAQATAALTPRDVAVVLDLSASHNDDSSLRAVKKTEIHNYEVWSGLKDNNHALAPKTDSLGFTSVVEVTDNGDGTSTVTVHLTSDGLEETAALSHVTFGLPEDAWSMAQSTATSGGGYPVSTGVDPTTGVAGLKFDETSLGEDGAVETEDFSFKVPNDCLKYLMVVGTKAGGEADTSAKYNLSPGPLLGNMNTWGDATAGPSWNPASDAGLVKLQKGANWSLSSAFVSQTLKMRGYGQYNAAEMSVINSSSGDSTTAAYKRRVRVALGLDRWKSGKPGGQPGGNGDNVIDAGEVVPMVAYPSQNVNPDSYSKKVGGTWDSYIDYVISSSSGMCVYDPAKEYYGDPNLRYSFGLKTWVDYLQECQVGEAASPGMAGVPTQPMGAVADAVKECVNIIAGLEGDDLVGMASYGTVSYGPADKPNNMSWLVDDFPSLLAKVDTLQAGMWTSYTNIAQGIDEGVEVLFNSPNGRRNAAKIMLLLTDGVANQTRNPVSYNTYQAREDTKTAARDARDRGVRIYTVSVGVSADKDLMAEVASIGGGSWFHAEGDIESYKDQLKAIFRELGGKRPGVLID